MGYLQALFEQGKGRDKEMNNEVQEWEVVKSAGVKLALDMGTSPGGEGLYEAPECRECGCRLIPRAANGWVCIKDNGWVCIKDNCKLAYKYVDGLRLGVVPIVVPVEFE